MLKTSREIENSFVFQQGIAPTHNAENSLVLQTVFDEWITSRGLWPSRPPDLEVCDFYLLGTWHTNRIEIIHTFRLRYKFKSRVFCFTIREDERHCMTHNLLCCVKFWKNSAFIIIRLKPKDVIHTRDLASLWKAVWWMVPARDGLLEPVSPVHSDDGKRKAKKIYSKVSETFSTSGRQPVGSLDLSA
jgi:hypothetical protein